MADQKLILFAGKPEISTNKNYKFTEVEEVNELLNQGWKVKDKTIIQANDTLHFSALILLEK